MFVSALALAPLLLALAARHTATRPETPASAVPQGDEIVVSEEAPNEYAPAVAYNSNHNEYLVVWYDGYDVVYGRRVSSSGQLLNRFVVSDSPNGKRQPAVAYDAQRDRYLVVFAYDYWGNGTDWDLYGRFIPWDGPSPSLHDFQICTWNSNQWRPALAWAPAQGEYLAAWQSETSGVPGYISARRIYADGSGFPADAITISSGTAVRDMPDVAYNWARNEYLLTWDVGGVDVAGVRLSATGTVLGAGELGIAGWPAAELHPAVAACHGADQYLVAWQSDQGTGGADWAIYARYVSGQGVLGNVYLIDDTTSPEREVDVDCTAGGDLYFQAWQTLYNNGWYGIWGRLAHPSETLEPQFGIVQPDDSHGRTAPATAGGRDSFLTAWEHETGFFGYRDIHARIQILAFLRDGFESGKVDAWSHCTP